MIAAPTRGDEIRVGDDRADDSLAGAGGVVASLSLEAAYLERDVYAVANPGIGYLSRGFELRLTLPIEALAIDLPPPSRERALWGVLRARTYLEDGALGLPLLSKLLARLRVGQPEDLFHLRGGMIHHSLGHGSVVWRYASTPDIDRRQTGAVLRLGTDLVGVEALVGNVLAPQRVSGARAYLRPILLFARGPGMLLELGQRLALGLGYAADWTAPLDPGSIADDGSYDPEGETASLVHIFADTEMILIDWAPLSAALYGDAGVRAGPARRLGAGAEVGLLSSARLWSTTLSLRAGLRLAGRDYRPGEFDAYYAVERVSTFGAGVPKASVRPSAGVGGVVEAGLSLSRWLQLRAQLDDAPGRDNSNAQLRCDLSAGPVRAAAAVAQRGFEGHAGLLSLGARTVGLAELRVETIGPIALVGRYWRTLRREAGRQRLDDDVLIGIEVGWLLQ